MAKIYKAGKDTLACKLSIHPKYLEILGWGAGDEVELKIVGKKLTMTKKVEV
jgi:hypothetical protein